MCTHALVRPADELTAKGGRHVLVVRDGEQSRHVGNRVRAELPPEHLLLVLGKLRALLP